MTSASVHLWGLRGSNEVEKVEKQTVSNDEKITYLWRVGRGHGLILQDTKIHRSSPLWRIRALLFTLKFWFSTILTLLSKETKKERKTEIVTKDIKQSCLRSPALIYVTSKTCNNQNHQPRRHMKSHLFYFSKETELDHPQARWTESPIALSPLEISCIPCFIQTKGGSVVLSDLGTENGRNISIHQTTRLGEQLPLSLLHVWLMKNLHAQPDTCLPLAAAGRSLLCISVVLCARLPRSLSHIEVCTHLPSQFMC